MKKGIRFESGATAITVFDKVEAYKPLGVFLRRRVSFVDFPLHHESGNLSYLFRFNITLVRRVQPIYRRLAALD